MKQEFIYTYWKKIRAGLILETYSAKGTKKASVKKRINNNSYKVLLGMMAESIFTYMDWSWQCESSVD